MTHCTNTAELARSPSRAAMLRIIEAGLDAIDTTRVVQQQVSLKGDTLSVAGHIVDLSHFKRVHGHRIRKILPRSIHRTGGYPGKPHHGRYCAHQ